MSPYRRVDAQRRASWVDYADDYAWAFYGRPFDGQAAAVRYAERCTGWR